MKSQLSNERKKRTEILATRSAESGEYAFANACRYCDNDGTNAIALISDDLDRWQKNLSEVPQQLIEAEEIIFLNKRISPSNAYLYMQGHCVYDILERIGRFLCYNTDFDFKTMVLDKNLAIGRYPEILTVVEDIRNQFKQWIY